MRRFDKTKNILKANILAESRYLESKGLVNEYDRGQFDSKYYNLDKERKEKLIDYSKERQIRDGLKFKGLNQKYEYYFLKDDINIYYFKDNEIEPLITTMRNLGDFFKEYNPDFGSSNLSYLIQKYKIRPEFVDFDKKNLKDSIKLTVRGSINNVLAPSLFNDGELSFDIDMVGNLKKQSDKYTPPFILDITTIQVRSMSGGDRGVIIPIDAKNAIMFNNIIKDKILEIYGKFDFNNPIFIKDVKIDRNATVK